MPWSEKRMLFGSFRHQGFANSTFATKTFVIGNKHTELTNLCIASITTDTTDLFLKLGRPNTMYPDSFCSLNLGKTQFEGCYATLPFDYLPKTNDSRSYPQQPDLRTVSSDINDFTLLWEVEMPDNKWIIRGGLFTDLRSAWSLSVLVCCNSAGYWSRELAKNWGPLQQHLELTNSPPVHPREDKSAELHSLGQCPIHTHT